MKSHNFSRRANAGFMLLEALIAFLIFSVGVLGLVGLQAAMTRAQSDAKYRADAAMMAQRLVGSMWADAGTAPGNGGPGATRTTNYVGASCASYTTCRQWQQDLAFVLPNGQGTIGFVSPQVTVTITWTAPDGQTHRYVTSSSIVTNPRPLP